VTDQGASIGSLSSLPAATGPAALGAAEDDAFDFHPPLTVGSGTIVLDAGQGSETLVGSSDASIVWLNHGAGMEEYAGGLGVNLLVSGSYAGTLIGGTGLSDTNTFILNAGVGAGEAPLVEIQNFNPAHDTLLLPAALYAGLGQQPLAGGNLLLLADHDAASRHAGADAAVMIVGSGSNADLYYYNPHDPYFDYQAHAYQLATIAGVSPADALAHIQFSNPQTGSSGSIG
jgi:Ca2+-binding RTX toxin-like protein